MPEPKRHLARVPGRAEHVDGARVAKRVRRDALRRDRGHRLRGDASVFLHHVFETGTRQASAASGEKYLASPVRASKTQPAAHRLRDLLPEEEHSLSTTLAADVHLEISAVELEVIAPQSDQFGSSEATGESEMETARSRAPRRVVGLGASKRAWYSFTSRYATSCLVVR